MMEIVKVRAFEILDSRGIPTVFSEVFLAGGSIGHAKVPSGVSTGSREAVELRDRDLRYGGMGVRKAINNVNTVIAKALLGIPADKMQLIDRTLLELDGTDSKSNLGANAMLSVSIAAARAASKEKDKPFYKYLLPNANQYILPTPLINLINGGAHANNNLDFQEFMIMPVGANSFSSAIEQSAEVIYALKKNLQQDNLSTAVGDEGGVAPNLKSNEEAIERILHAIEITGLKPGRDICLALDLAGGELFEDDKYKIYLNKKDYTNEQFIDYLEGLVKNYPIISIEDPLDENDWEGWQIVTKLLGNKVQIVGDDVFVTNYNIIKKGVQEKIANSLLVKPNQIGTLTETFEAIDLAKSSGYSLIISHRSGDTDDTTIADLAVATCSGQIKTGSLARGERISKYNRLLQIESQLGHDKVKYAGWDYVKAKSV